MTLRASPDALLHASLVLAHAMAISWMIRRGPLRTRPALITAVVVAALPSSYVAAVETGVVSGEFLRFSHPSLLPLLLLSMLFVAYRLARAPLSGPVRRLVVDAATSAAVLFAGLAAAEPESGGRLERLAVLLVIDQSRSMELVPDAEQRLLSERRVAELGMRDDDLVGVVVFGSESAVEEPLRRRSALPSPAKVSVGRDATDLEAAIRRALSEVPADAAARIVVLSDGVATRGDAADAAAAARVADVPVDTVPLDQRKLTNVRAAALRMPQRADEDEAVDLRVVVQTPKETDLDIRVYRDGELIRTERGRVLGGEDVLHIRERAPAPGLHRYDVDVTAADPLLDELTTDNRASAFVRVEGRARALILDNFPDEATPISEALTAAAFEVDVAPATSAPADVAGYAAYDVVILSDIPAQDFSPSQIDALGTYVKSLGGGLFLMGGARSMGPGGYGATAVERVSPVSFDLKQSRRRASLAEVIIIDFSGSMAASAGRQTKLELANEAAVRSAKLLGEGDRVGVMHVDDRVHWTVPLGSAGREVISSAIRRVETGGGGIYIDISLVAAYEALSAERTNLKHVLLFSDGSDAEQKERAPALVRDARARGVTTSVVALGRGQDVPALEALSRDGNGRFYLIEDASRLPAVFAQETIAATRSAINEVVFTPAVAHASRATRDIDWASAPSLSGYVVTLPKERTEVLLRAPENDPLLATSAVGVGRSAAFTSDFKGRWTGHFVNFSGAAQMVAQVARDVARRAGDPRVRLEARTAEGRLLVRTEALRDDGRADSFRRFVARVGGPDGWEREVPLEPRQAGVYGAEIPLSRPGAYAVSVADENGVAATAAASFTPADEVRPTGTDRGALAAIANISGGKVRDTLAGVFDDRTARRFAYRPVADSLLLLAGLALIAGVAGRRAAMPDAIPRLLAAASARLARRPAPPSRSARAAGTAGALLSAKAARRTAYPKTLPRELVRGLPSDAPLAPATRGTPRAPEAPPLAAPRADGGEAPRPAPPATSAASAPTRRLTSAEILLARRRERR